MDTIIGVFEDRVEADLTMQDLEDHGYQPKDISLFWRRPIRVDIDKKIGRKGGRVIGGLQLKEAVIDGVTNILKGLGPNSQKAILIAVPVDNNNTQLENARRIFRSHQAREVKHLLGI